VIGLGIDPGKAGGIALVGPDGPIEYCRMPESDRDMWHVIREWAEIANFALIERVGAGVFRRPSAGSSGEQPRQGVKSAFSFGQNYGALRLALCASELPYDDVLPRTWKARMGCLAPSGETFTDTQKKRIDKEKAQQLFPCVKVTNAIADALLIAEYARRLQLQGVA
jgi:hypothetical protein